jgi:hypothetical protein
MNDVVESEKIDFQRGKSGGTGGAFPYPSQLRGKDNDISLTASQVPPHTTPQYTRANH